MPPINITNPWGRQAGTPPAGALDAQRTDLWQLNLTSVVDWINTTLSNNKTTTTFGQSINVPLARANNLLAGLPDPSTACYYVRSIELPDLNVDTQPITRDTLPYNMPAVDKPPGTVSVTFLVDTPVPNSPLGSKLIALLYAWRALVRAGRGSFDGGFSTNNSYELALGLLDASGNAGSLQPQYRFDVPLNLLRGDTPTATGGRSQAIHNDLVDTWQVGTAGLVTNSTNLQYSTTLMIRQMWLAGFKPGNFKYGESGLVEIPATFYCSDVVPVAPPT